MAVDRKQFINTIESGLKANKDYKKFYISFKLEGVSKQKVLNYTTKEWDKKTRINKAKTELQNEKSKQVNNSLNFTENSTINAIADIYYDIACNSTDWTKELKYIYDLYCRDNLGKKKIKDIRKVHIDSLRKKMEEKGLSKQTENGCSTRTIKKVLVQSLKPVLQYAVDNKVIDDIPTIKIPSQPKIKKTVKYGGVKLATLYSSIFELYKDDGFYRALFLFALYGRRWNEIRTLEWSDINLLDATYTIRAINNKIGEEQTYELPEPIRDALIDIQDDTKGLVFKSPVTGKELYPPKKQLAKLKELSGIEELTMHYFRHILVTAMGEVGTAATVLSASLGHTNLKTVNEFYLSANHTKGSKVTNDTIMKITQK